jgi:hypothetical protein
MNTENLTATKIIQQPAMMAPGPGAGQQTITANPVKLHLTGFAVIVFIVVRSPFVLKIWNQRICSIKKGEPQIVNAK